MKKFGVLLLTALVTYGYGMENADSFEIARIDENHQITIAGQQLHARNYSTRNNENPFILVLHYTAGALAGSAHTLTEGKDGVSAHYLIPEYESKQPPLPIYQLVREEDTAHHAGISQWRDQWRQSAFGTGKTINAISLGIEIVNYGYERTKIDNSEIPILGTQGNLQFKPFSKEQMKRVIYISRELVNRHKLEPWNITGHSDVATWPSGKESWELRKVDPGAAFDWKLLSDHGVGMWPRLKSGRDNIERPARPDIVWLKKALEHIGYYIDNQTDHLDDTSLMSLNAFRLHYHKDAYSHMYYQPVQWQSKEAEQTQQILYELITQYEIPRPKKSIFSVITKQPDNKEEQ